MCTIENWLYGMIASANESFYSFFWRMIDKTNLITGRNLESSKFSRKENLLSLSTTGDTSPAMWINWLMSATSWPSIEKRYLFDGKKTYILIKKALREKKLSTKKSYIRLIEQAMFNTGHLHKLIFFCKKC